MSGVAPLITSTQRTEALVISTLIQLVIMIGAARIGDRGQEGCLGLPAEAFGPITRYS